MKKLLGMSDKNDRVYSVENNSKAAIIDYAKILDQLEGEETMEEIKTTNDRVIGPGEPRPTSYSPFSYTADGDCLTCSHGKICKLREEKTELEAKTKGITHSKEITIKVECDCYEFKSPVVAYR